MIKICDYDASWPDAFRQIRDRVWPHISHIAVGFEHVGSTSVPGLPAKPVIDIDIVIPSRGDLTRITGCLEAIGYEHRGDLGIPDRDAFRQPPRTPAQHVYVCPSASVALRNHLTLRDHLRAHPSDRDAYAALKQTLAAAYDDVDEYARGKTQLIIGLLEKYKFSSDELALIRRVNE